MRQKFLLPLLALFALFGNSAWAQTFTQGSLKYTVTSATAKTVSVAKANNNITGTITIPSSVTNSNVTYSVTSIADYGFESTSITAVTIPASVAKIGYYAFKGTQSLTKLTIQDSATPIEFVTGYNTSFGTTAKEVYIGRDINRTGDYSGERLLENAVKVTFGPKVTTIPNNLLSGQDSMHTLVIGDGVKTIGDDAFKSDRYGEPELSVTFGANVESIGARAFQSCFALKNITLPAKLKTIGSNAFDGTYISSITIPASVTDIEQYAFYSCGQLTYIKFEASSKPVNFVTGYYRSFGDSAKEVYIGRDINRTGDYAAERLFNNITKVTFGSKVTEIGQNMFSNNNELATIVIGSGVKAIREGAFYNCGTTADIEELKVTMGANVETLETNAFQYCSKLKSITIPSKLKVIGTQAFQHCGLTTLTIPANVNTINYYAFQACDALASVRIEESTEPLEFFTGYYRSFGDHPKTVFYGRNVVRTGDYTGERMFNKVTNLTISDKVTEIPNWMFDGNNELKDVTIGTGVKLIGESAFRNCGTSDDVTELKVKLGVNVDSLAIRAFQGCTKLQTVSLPSSLKVIEEAAFQSTGLTTLSIPASVKRLGYYAFHACDSLTSVNIEASTEPIEFVTGFYRSFGNNPKTVFYGRNVVRTGGYANERMFNKVTELTIGDKVTEVPSWMFDGNNELKNVTIGSGVKYIGESAFRNCGTSDDVTELKVEMGANVDSLAAYAFQSCTKLKAISLPSSLKVIEEAAFQSTGLTELYIPASVKRLGYYAFHACDALASVNIEASTEPLEFVTGYYRSFGDAAKEVFVGRNINRTGSYTNERMFNKVTELTIGDKVTEVPSWMFDGNNELKNVTIGSGVKYIGESAFRNCGTSDDVTELKVEMGANVDSLAAYAFQSCTKLKAISLPSSLKVIEEAAFQSTGLTELYIPASVKRLGYYAFHACDALASVNIEASTEPLEFVTGYYRSFGDAAKEVFVGRNINRTGDYTNERVFNNMTKLTIGDMVTEIGSNMFNGNNELKAVYVSWTQPITINTNVFNNATYQTATLYVPGGTKAKYAAATGWKNFYNVQAWSVIVKLTASAHGTIKTKYGTASNGSTIQFNQPKDEPLVYTITADNGYKLSALTDNGTAVSPLPQLGTAQTRAIADGEETIILAATFAPVSYTITYDLAGGAMPSGKTNPTSYNIETATFTLNNPTRDYYDFAGWTGTGLTAPTKTVTIAKGSTGNRSYTATWTPKTYTVTITGAGVTASNYSPKYGESVVITIEEDPDRTLTSLTVNGTDVTSQVRNNKYTITNVSSNIEVVATFKSTKEFITLTDQYAMFSCPQDLDFTGTSLRAYIASGFNKATSQVLLTPVTDVPAGTGIFLIGTPGQTYKIPYSETTSYYVNLFQANLTKKTVSATTGSYSNYTFGVQGGDPGFYPINGSTTLQAQTAYLQLPTSFVTAGVKVSVVFEDDIIDGIDTIDNGQWTIDNEVYNLAGQRLGKMQKGINIVNGKKVLVK